MLGMWPWPKGQAWFLSALSQLSLWLGRVLLPSGPPFPYRATHHSELVEKMG